MSADRMHHDAATGDAPKGESSAANKPASSVPKRLGKYTLLRQLGRGGKGVVVEALDTELNRKVALKQLLPGTFSSPQQRQRDEERFLREARFTANLPSHPNIVSVYEAGLLEGRRYLAMELIVGESMATWRQKGSLPLKTQIGLLVSVALAVDHAHQHGIMHRDLKPQNVLVDGQGRPYVTDFGLAKAMGQETGMSLTVEGMLLGTPVYMSPEQARGLKTIDRRTDIYSMGVMLYEMLSGRAPFTGETPMEILMKVVKDPVVPPTKVLPARWKGEEVRALEDICLKALAKEPEQRYATAKMMAGDLTKWLKGEEVKVARPRGRRMWVGLGIAAAVALVGVVAIAGLRGSGRLVKKDLETARQMMEEKRYAEALLAYGQTLARDGGNAEALEGQRAAQTKIEEDKQIAVKEIVEKLEREAAEAQRESELRRQELEAKQRQKQDAARDAEKKRLADELQVLENRAVAAEEAARKAQGKLAESDSPSPARAARPPDRRGNRYQPEQATGQPDTPNAGDHATAWASKTPDGSEEWLQVDYTEAVVPKMIRIHETYNPGAVARVALFDSAGEEHLVWAGKDPIPAGSAMGVSEIPVSTSIRTKRVKIYLDSVTFRGWNEIDAVALVDLTGKSQWAVAAQASSTYGR